MSQDVVPLADRSCSLSRAGAPPDPARSPRARAARVGSRGPWAARLPLGSQGPMADAEDLRRRLRRGFGWGGREAHGDGRGEVRLGGGEAGTDGRGEAAAREEDGVEAGRGRADVAADSWAPPPCGRHVSETAGQNRPLAKVGRF